MEHLSTRVDGDLIHDESGQAMDFCGPILEQDLPSNFWLS